MSYNSNLHQDLSLYAQTQQSIRRLEQATDKLAARVAELEQHNLAARASRADETLKADVNAARGIAPGKGDVASLIEMRKFVQDILDPEMYGYAVSREVRNAARRVLGIDAKE